MSNECKQISESIQTLSLRIEKYQSYLERRINSLESQSKNLSSKVQGLDQDIKNIISRVNSHEIRITKLEVEPLSSSSSGRNQLNRSQKDLQKLKQQILAIERYINALDKAGVSINNALKGIFKIFKVFK